MATAYEVNLISLIEKFHGDDDRACREKLAALRWPDGVECPKCANKSISRIVERDQYDCNSCRYQFSVTSGTIMHDTHLPLWKWFVAIYMMVESKKGVSANQLKRMIGVSYQTAWYLCHRIREALKTPHALLSGIIEVDETYIGGKTQGKGRAFTGNKSIVAGAVERDGRAVLEVVPNTKKVTLHAFVKGNVSDDAEAIHTDEHPSYVGIGDENTRHETVNHRADEWVRGDVHTNSVESVWALFKRGVVGSFHQISKKHLERYLDEFEFRFANRNNPHIFRDALIEIVRAEHIKYEQLVG